MKFVSTVAAVAATTLSPLSLAAGVGTSRAPSLRLVTQASTDVQILQAWTDKSIELIHSDCVGMDPIPGESVLKDCTQQAQRLTKAPWADRESPAVNDWMLPMRNYNGQVYSPNYSGHIVEIRALVRRAALDTPTFTGIGFYFHNMIQGNTVFIPKDQLHIVSDREVVLRNGGDHAVVMRFVGWMPGYQGHSGTGWCMDRVFFKPFARFTTDRENFENWDVAPNDYVIFRCESAGGTRQVMKFNREQELLAD